MFSAIRRRFTYANVAMTLALLFAMTGGAYAANKYLIISTKQISPKVLKALKGSNGVNGAAGLAGPAGPAGPAGAGAPGKEGSPGKEGLEGKPGTSVTSSVEPKGVNCKEGGSKFVAGASTTYACAGKEGPEGKEGKEGSPWTAGGALPKGATETGIWGVLGAGIHIATISYVLPVEPTPASNFLKEGFPTGATKEEEEHCPGSATEPKAAPGQLCIYTTSEAETAVVLGQAVAHSGFVMGFSGGSANASAFGPWAVTAK